MEIKKVLRKFCPSGSFIHFSLSSCRLVFLSSCLPVILSSCLPVVLSSCRSVSWRRHLFAWEDQNTKRLNRTPFHRTIQSRIQFFKILFFTATNTIQASNEATYLLARRIESSVVIWELVLCLHLFLISQRQGKGHSHRKPTASWSPQSS